MPITNIINDEQQQQQAAAAVSSDLNSVLGYWVPGGKVSCGLTKHDKAVLYYLLLETQLSYLLYKHTAN